MATIEDGAVRQSLLDDYSVVPPPVFSNDPPPDEILADIRAEEERRLTEQFQR